MKEFPNRIDSLVGEVIAKIGDPVSPRVVVACLESFGIRDKDVPGDYGFASLDDLAMRVFDAIRGKRGISDLRNLATRERDLEKGKIRMANRQLSRFMDFIAYYSLGLFHVLPVFIQVAAIVLYGYSLWAFLGFNILQSTAVILGVILGLIFSGGYVQVMGRQASYYWNNKSYDKARWVIIEVIREAIIGMLKTFVLLIVTNFLFNLYPFSFLLIVLTYTFLIALLVMVMAPLYTIRHRWGISLAVFLSTSVALALHFRGVWVYVSHWVGIVLAIAISALILYRVFRKYGALEGPEKLPRKSMILYRNYRYFFYGLLIYLFIFLDRILAWTADTGISHRFMLLYEKDYEIGMDLAILVFFMLAGVMEYAIASFVKSMDRQQKSRCFSDSAGFNRYFRRMYVRHLAVLLVSAVGTFLLVYWVATSPDGYAARFEEPIEPLSLRVCLIGSIGYLLLTLGMLNSLYMFSLNQSRQALGCLIAALIVNFGLGFFLSRWWSFEYSSVGFLCGAVVFASLTTRELLRYFSNLDYHYYAAY